MQRFRFSLEMAPMTFGGHSETAKAITTLEQLEAEDVTSALSSFLLALGIPSGTLGIRSMRRTIHSGQPPSNWSLEVDGVSFPSVVVESQAKTDSIFDVIGHDPWTM